MRRLWMSALLAPVVALAVPVAALAAPSAPARPAEAAARAASAAPAAAGRVLQVGSTGSSVRGLQRRLAQLKYYPGSIDGKFGTNTLEAVWAFQEVQGLRGSSSSNRPRSRRG